MCRSQLASSGVSSQGRGTAGCNRKMCCHSQSGHAPNSAYCLLCWAVGRQPHQRESSATHNTEGQCPRHVNVAGTLGACRADSIWPATSYAYVFGGDLEVFQFPTL